MRSLVCVAMIGLLSGCHHAPVRCDTHLVPINPVSKTAANPTSGLQGTSGVRP